MRKPIAEFKRLPETELLVNALRELLGMRPLYGRNKTQWQHEPCGRYLELEALSKRANPSCGSCEGAGYIPQAGAHGNDRRCACVLPLTGT